MGKRLFESKKEYEERLKREELEAKSGVSKNAFESMAHFEKRANQVYLDQNAGISRKMFESEKDFRKRQEAAIVEKKTGISRRHREDEEKYIERARKESLDHEHHMFPKKGEKISGDRHERNIVLSMEKIAKTRKGTFESQERYEQRLRMQTLAALGNVKQGTWESDEDFERRSKLAALKNNREMVERLGLDD